MTANRARGRPRRRPESRHGTDAGGRPAQGVGRPDLCTQGGQQGDHLQVVAETAVAIDAFLHLMMAEAPMPDTGSAAEDLRLTLRGLMGFYISQLIS